MDFNGWVATTLSPQDLLKSERFTVRKRIGLHDFYYSEGYDAIMNYETSKFKILFVQHFLR